MAASYKAKGNEGRHTGNHPIYGYIHDPDDKEKWIVDEKAASIVRRVFSMTLDGKGPYAIASVLEKEKVLSPSYYLAQKGKGNNKNKDFANPYLWWGTTVTYLLERIEYMGHTVNFKTYKKHYRDKNRKKAPPDEWKIFEHTHDAIIDKETWNTVQKMRQTVRRSYNYEHEANRLTGLVFCADCGGKMYHECGIVEGKPTRSNYVCSSYRKHTTDCTMHFIRVEVLEELILDTLRKVSRFAQTNEDDFIRLITETSSFQQEEIEKAHRKRLTVGEKRIAELDVLIQKIYEDNVNGKITDKRFEKLSSQYEAEQEALEQEIEILQAEISGFDDKNSRADKFLELVRRYTDLTELTTPMLNEFVEKVIVHERVKGGRYKKSQRVDIHLNFIGMVELPSTMPDIVSEQPPVKRYVAANTSFASLAEFLEKQDAETLTLSFEEIEKIIGKPLCKSARKYKSYWYPAYDRPLSNVIYNARYDVVRVE